MELLGSNTDRPSPGWPIFLRKNHCVKRRLKNKFQDLLLTSHIQDQLSRLDCNSAYVSVVAGDGMLSLLLRLELMCDRKSWVH